MLKHKLFSLHDTMLMLALYFSISCSTFTVFYEYHP